MEKNNYDGITILVLSFERMKSLKVVLDSLLAQDLGGIPTELIVCNNSPREYLKKSRFSAVGRCLRRFTDIKIINCSYSWHTNIRYALATLAKYNTVLFLDDDIIVRRHDFIKYMFNTYKQLGPLDILSCWNRLLVEWDADDFSLISLNFNTPGIEELTQCDVAGPGICMFNKDVLTPKVMDVVMAHEYPNAYDMGFSLISKIEHNSECFFLPSHGMLENYRQHGKTTLMTGPENYDDLHSLFKSMLKKGYKPVVSRHYPGESEDSPERRAIQMLTPRKLSW